MSTDAAATPSLDLGAIGNGAASALVDARGTIVWSCWPRFDGDPVFHALLGRARNTPADTRQGACDDAGKGDGAFGIEFAGPGTA